MTRLVAGMGFSPDGARLAATDSCGELEIWNTTTKDVVGHRVEFGDLSSLGVASVDGEHVAVATQQRGASSIGRASDQTVRFKEHTRTCRTSLQRMARGSLTRASTAPPASGRGRGAARIEHPEEVASAQPTALDGDDRVGGTGRDGMPHGGEDCGADGHDESGVTSSAPRASEHVGVTDGFHNIVEDFAKLSRIV